MNNLSHGEASKHQQNFLKLLPLQTQNYDMNDLAKLAEQMKGGLILSRMVLTLRRISLFLQATPILVSSLIMI